MFDRTTYIERRKRLSHDLGSGLILFPGNAEAPMNYLDNQYPFRQDSSFLYFWGLDTPDLAAIVDVDERRDTLYGDDFTVDEIVWRGPQKTVAERAAEAGVATTAPRSGLQQTLAEALRLGRRVHFLPQYRGENAILLETLLGIRAASVNQHASVALIKAVVAQRSIKSTAEVGQIETALETTREMHVLAMTRARPGVYEREIAGAMEGLAFSKDVRLAFPIIFSIHGETLHNHHHGNRMEAGQMAVNDSGAESPFHYASDITRTIPIGGRFVGAQRDLYLAVRRAQVRAIDAIKPGVRHKDVHLLACRSLAEDLKALGCMRGDLDTAVEAGAHALFFQCGLGHMMGFDVHDMEGIGEQYVGYDDTVERSQQFGLRSLRLGRALQPGFVVTTEPGVYFIPELIDMWKAQHKFDEFINYEAVEEFRRFGGIRIEDNVLVTGTGHRVLGPPIPVEIDEVEQLASG